MLCLPKIKPLTYKQFYNFGIASPLLHIISYMYIIDLYRSLYVILFLYCSMVHIVYLHRLIYCKIKLLIFFSGFMIAAPFALIRSPGHIIIYVLITKGNNTYVLVNMYSIYYKYVSN